MSTETEKDTRLFLDQQGGRVVCFKHLGGYGRFDVEAHPQGTSKTADGRRQWMTPLDVWMQMEQEDFDAWVALMKEYGDENPTPPSCEDCRHEAKS